MLQTPSRIASIVAWTCLAGILGITAIALVSSRWGWPLYFELLSHFQGQYWALSCVGLGAIVLTRRARPALVALACVVALTAQLWPWYWPPHFLTGGDRGSFRVLLANVQTQNRNFDAVRQWAQDEAPDLALFVEVDDRWVEQLNPLLATLPYFAGQTSDDNFGIVIYSRYALENVELVNFHPDSRLSVTATLRIHDQPLSLVGTHPLPPNNLPYFRSRNRQLDRMGRYLQSLEGAKLVLGDLNITMWSPYYQRLMRQTGLKNARDGFGLLPTWPTGKLHPLLPRWVTRWWVIPIDHGLVSPDLTVTDMRVGPDVGSDHRPIVIDLRW